MLLTVLAISSFIILSPGCGVRGAAPANAGMTSMGNPIIGIVPSRGAPSVGYCKRNGDELVVTFANSGELPSSGTVNVTVDFSPGNDVVLPMPSIQPGTSVDMNFPIPYGCFDPDCSFSIKWSNQPPVSGICIG